MEKEKPKKASDLYMEDIKKQNREPTKQEYQVLGSLIFSEKVHSIKEKFERAKEIFKGGGKKDG